MFSFLMCFSLGLEDGVGYVGDAGFLVPVLLFGIPSAWDGLLVGFLLFSCLRYDEVVRLFGCI